MSSTLKEPVDFLHENEKFIVEFDRIIKESLASGLDVACDAHKDSRVRGVFPDIWVTNITPAEEQDNYHPTDLLVVAPRKAKKITAAFKQAMLDGKRVYGLCPHCCEEFSKQALESCL